MSNHKRPLNRQNRHKGPRSANGAQKSWRQSLKDQIATPRALIADVFGAPGLHGGYPLARLEAAAIRAFRAVLLFRAIGIEAAIANLIRERRA